MQVFALGDGGSVKKLSICLILLSICHTPALASTDDAFAAARQTLVELDWKSAIRLYTPLRDAAKPGSKEWNEATYCLATAYHHVQPPSYDTIQSALNNYQQVIDKASDPRFVARAMMNLGRVYELRDYPEDIVDMDKAREAYEQVVARFPGDPIAGEAALRAASTLVMAFDEPNYEKVKAGVAFLEKWLADHPNEELASVMWQYIGDAYFRPLQDYKNALQAYEKVDKLGWTDQGNQGPWYWRCAQLAERFLDQPEPEIAAKYYAKIIIETPNSGKAYESMQALRRLNKPVPYSPLFAKFDPTAQPTTQEAVTTQPATQRSDR